MDAKAKIFIISGEAGSGKTRLITKLVSGIKQNGIKITGIISPARFEHGKKTGIFAEDIYSQERMLLAYYQPGWDPENPKREWKMDPEVLKWGESILLNSTPTRVLIIDELGYLEFEKDTGWTKAFDILEEGLYEVAIIAVRESLLPLAVQRWKTAKVIHLEEPSQIIAQAADLEAQILATVNK